MLPLRELQGRFVAQLLEPGDGSAELYVRADGIAPSARLGIYRNNMHEAFAKTLVLEFPVIERLVGKEYFRQVAEEFIKWHPSRSGDLHHIGAPFAAFLREQFTGSPYAYLSDVATLEWALQECLVAKESSALDIAALRSIPVQAYGSLRFALRPSCRLVHSPFPILRIWEVNQAGPDDELVRLDAGPDHILVCRSSDGVLFHRLAPAEFRLLAAFASDAPLDAALEGSLAVDARFDLGQALRRFVSIGALARLEPHSTPRNAP